MDRQFKNNMPPFRDIKCVHNYKLIFDIYENYVKCKVLK